MTLLLHIFFYYYLGKKYEVLAILQTMDVGNIKQQKLSRVQVGKSLVLSKLLETSLWLFALKSQVCYLRLPQHK